MNICTILVMHACRNFRLLIVALYTVLCCLCVDVVAFTCLLFCSNGTICTLLANHSICVYVLEFIFQELFVLFVVIRVWVMLCVCANAVIYLFVLNVVMYLLILTEQFVTHVSLMTIFHQHPIHKNHPAIIHSVSQAIALLNQTLCQNYKACIPLVLYHWKSSLLQMTQKKVSNYSIDLVWIAVVLQVAFVIFAEQKTEFQTKCGVRTNAPHCARIATRNIDHADSAETYQGQLRHDMKNHHQEVMLFNISFCLQRELLLLLVHQQKVNLERLGTRQVNLKKRSQLHHHRIDAAEQNHRTLSRYGGVLPMFRTNMRLEDSSTHLVALLAGLRSLVFGHDYNRCIGSK